MTKKSKPSTSKYIIIVEQIKEESVSRLNFVFPVRNGRFTIKHVFTHQARHVACHVCALSKVTSRWVLNVVIIRLKGM
jgi:hypothetical protein